MGGLGVILVAIMISFVGCAPKVPVNTIEIKKIDAVRYAKCMMDSIHEGIPLVRLKRECEDYAEIVKNEEERTKAINSCLIMKESEKWNQTELEYYCAQNWRSHR